MAFTQGTRVWWDTSKPGAGTAKLDDATVPTTPDAGDDSGIVGLHQDKQVECDRSGFVVPASDTVIDPVSGHRVLARFADKQVEQPANALDPGLPNIEPNAVRPEDD